MISHGSKTETSAEVVDPVCGMKIASEKAAGEQEYGGHTYYFCGRSCLDKFKADPTNFVTPKTKQAPALPDAKAVEYTCPMHPEVLQKGSGSCPKCGMALEPATPSAPAKHSDWTWPMHPQISKDGPGQCPICFQRNPSST